MKTITLNNGLTMPSVGFGVFQIAPEQTKQAVLDALQAGYRSIDTAEAYQNEEAVGQAIKNSGIERKELFLTTKLWIRANGYDGAMRGFEKSCQRLGTDYVDLYLIHQPMGDVFGEWRALQELYQAGQIKAIGVSNFHNDRVMDLMTHFEIKPAINQIEMHPFYQRAEELAFHQEHQITLQSWASFAEGKNDIFQNPILSQIGENYGKSVAQVILRWLVQQGIPVNPKSVNPERMAQNIDIFDFNLSDDDMALIKGLDSNSTLFFSHRDPVMVKWLGERAIKD